MIFFKQLNWFQTFSKIWGRGVSTWKDSNNFQKFGYKTARPLWNKQPIFEIIKKHLISYPTTSVNYFWSFGALVLFVLIIQIITGVFLAMHYTAEINLAFDSIEHIMRDVQNGWLIRYMHLNGASFIFFCLYIHILRGLFYGSFVDTHVWYVGIILLVLMMATSFLGYVLPWGQMSYWAATVVTNLFSAIPIVGTSIVEWLWGGFSVANPTLNRFFSLHYLIPFLIIALTIIHIFFLHLKGSNNNLGLFGKTTTIAFYPYFFVKDLFVGFVMFFFYFSFIYFVPNYLGHPDNYINANPLVTPAHIVPEWYFLPFYAMLRAVPNKLLGVIIFFGAFIVLFFLPKLNYDGTIRSCSFGFFSKFCFWLFVFNCLILGWIGGAPAEIPFLGLSQICTFFYFFYLLFLQNKVRILDEKLILVFQLIKL